MASGRPGRRLQLRRWYGPGLLVAIEGANGTGFAAKRFVSFRGQLTKRPMEILWKASSLENFAAGSWEAAIDVVLKAAQCDVVADDALPAQQPESLDDGLDGQQHPLLSLLFLHLLFYPTLRLWQLYNHKATIVDACRCGFSIWF